MQYNSRREYNLDKLNLGDLPENPIDGLEYWLKDAETQQVPDYNAFHLATSNASGHVSGRIVLLKNIEDGRLVFYTNYDSRKGQQIAENNRVAATFFWSQMDRQVRVEGTVSCLTASKSDAYFHSRPIESQAAAAASHQSKKIAQRKTLAQRYDALLQQPDKIKRPEHWGGYAIEPHYIEFWQGRPGRLHDRIVFEKADGWIKYRVQP